MAPPPGRRPPRRWRSVLRSWLVVAVAPASLGILTFTAFWYAAARLRSRLLALCAAGYTLATVLEAVWAGPSGAEPAPGFAWMIAITLIVGTGHLIAIRGRLAQALAGPPVADPPPEPVGSVPAGRVPALEQDPVYVAAVLRRTRREQARALVVDNPALAAELGVGRPDLGHGFDDGGLIDINAVPATVLAGLPGFTDALADDVVSARDRLGGRFFAAEDLVVLAGVPAEVVEQIRDRLLFRPL